MTPHRAPAHTPAHTPACAAATGRACLDTVLPSGLRLVALHTPDAPLAELRLVIPFARTEPALASSQRALAACLGTGARTAAGRILTRQDIADRAADLGAELSTVVTAESLVVGMGVLAAGLPGALDLLADLLLRPHHTDREIALAHARHPGAGARPAGRARLRATLLARAFGDHPLLGPGLATAPAGPVPQVAELHALHRRAVVPAGSVLLVTGEVDPAAVVARAEEALGAWRGGPSGLFLPPFARDTPAPGRTALAAASGDGPAQASLLTAGPAERGHAPLHLAQLVLGGHASSRLAERLRDRHGLAYAVSATLRENRAGCWLETEAAGAPGMASLLAEETVGCLRELAEHGPTAAETERARRYALGFTRFALATRAEEATALSGFLAAGLPLDWLDRYRDVLESVTHRQVIDAASTFLDPDRMAVATLEPGAPAHHDETEPAA
ncbi:M16 family metallopeptidase [Kitasatospora sp. NPDC087861]|uniref:M16 family metallopeptidase n=1 Tax=Kitasatospora sp. NPDC087861 TaxID=3364070 RepID=UPI0038068F6E